MMSVMHGSPAPGRSAPSMSSVSTRSLTAGLHQRRQVIDELRGLFQGVLSVHGRRDAERHVIGERRTREAVVGHARGVVAARGFELEAARPLEVQRDCHLGQAGGVLGIGVDLHRRIAGDVSHAVNGGCDRRRAAAHLIDVQLDDGPLGQGRDGEVTEHGAPVESRVHLTQCRERVCRAQRPA